MSEPLADPPLTPDGTCVGCGKPRKLEGIKPLYRKHASEDPFCSTACARAWHGVKLPDPAQRGRRAYVSKREEVTPYDPGHGPNVVAPSPGSAAG